MIAQQACTVCSGQERHNVFKSRTEIGYRHISAAYKAIARAYDCTHRRRLTVGRKRKVYAGRQRRAKHHQQEYVEYYKQKIGHGDIPAGCRKVKKAGSCRNKADYKRRHNGRNIISERHGTGL